ncbi:MAG: hypothetical protein Q4G16_10960 [Cruoricaptor ignavus]|nr:hypothetical protein [Cruoricaptor ignavus]
MNNFAVSNNITVTNLQKEAFCFNNLFLTDLEKKSLDITIIKNNYHENLNIRKINFNKNDINNSIKSKISFPLFSNDKRFVYIVIQTYEANSINFYHTEVLYKISEIEGKWIIVDSYKTITQN